jgi:cytidylate kinase
VHVVTISATYGAGGALIGPAVAERLGVPFVDRAIPREVADELGVPVDHVLCRDDQARGWLGRLLAAAAPMSAEWTIDPDHARTALLSDTDILRCTEGVIRKACRDGGVILGRAGAIVLRDHPTAFHVRLDGDPQRRVRQAMVHLGVPEHEAREGLLRNDKARVAYVRQFYNGADPAHPQHYHLVLDSTRIPLETCTDLIVSAVRAGVARR